MSGPDGTGGRHLRDGGVRCRRPQLTDGAVRRRPAPPPVVAAYGGRAVSSGGSQRRPQARQRGRPVGGRRLPRLRVGRRLILLILLLLVLFIVLIVRLRWGKSGQDSSATRSRQLVGEDGGDFT